MREMMVNLMKGLDSPHDLRQVIPALGKAGKPSAQDPRTVALWGMIATIS